METGTAYRNLAEHLSAGDDSPSFVIRPPRIPDDAIAPAPHKNGMIGVYSSGSTGKPKLNWWNLELLLKNCSKSGSTEGWTWATCYHPWSFAGVQLACQAHVSKGKVLFLGRDWKKNHSLLQNENPQALSATPTFIDLLIQSTNPSNESNESPKQITMGGEILRPPTGARIQEAFPASRKTLIYATAELGIIAKTNRMDGWFPLTSLKQQFSNFKLTDNVLNLEFQGTWVSTRDLCELEGDHFRITGRLDRVLNIGGEKICLDQIETVAESFQEVRRANAQAKPNAITGYIVALDLEPTTPDADDALLDDIMNQMRKLLPKPAWPRWYSWNKIREMNNGKRSFNKLDPIK